MHEFIVQQQQKQNTKKGGRERKGKLLKECQLTDVEKELENNHFSNTSVIHASDRDHRWMLSPPGMLLGNTMCQSVIPQIVY